jgi:polyisoprenoid-binding protein YceI
MAELIEKSAESTSVWSIDPAHSTVEFAVKHMVITTVRGRFNKFEIDLNFDEANPGKATVEARIDSSSIDTRVADRDAHLRSADFLDVEHFPLITFKSRRVEPAGQERYRIVGDLTIRGVTREVILDATVGVAKNPWGMRVVTASAETKINRKDFGLNWNAALETGGWLVGDEVKISLEIEAVKQG